MSAVGDNTSRRKGQNLTKILFRDFWVSWNSLKEAQIVNYLMHKHEAIIPQESGTEFFRFSSELGQGSTHRLVRAPVVASWCDIFGILLVPVLAPTGSGVWIPELGSQRVSDNWLNVKLKNYKKYLDGKNVCSKEFKLWRNWSDRPVRPPWFGFFERIRKPVKGENTTVSSSPCVPSSVDTDEKEPFPCCQ